jgi:transposase
MIAPPLGAHIWLTADAADLRRGFTGLSALVQTTLDASGTSSCWDYGRGPRRMRRWWANCSASCWDGA